MEGGVLLSVSSVWFGTVGTKHEGFIPLKCQGANTSTSTIRLSLATVQVMNYHFAMLDKCEYKFCYLCGQSGLSFATVLISSTGLTIVHDIWFY